MSVQQSMKGLRALWQLGEVAVLERLRKRVEQAPDIACGECLMTRFTPFVQDARDVTVATNTYVCGPHDEIVRNVISKVGILVGGSPRLVC